MRAKSTKTGIGEYEKFSEALKTILSVPHSKIKAKLETEKRKRVKNASASHGAIAKG